MKAKQASLFVTAVSNRRFGTAAVVLLAALAAGMLADIPSSADITAAPTVTSFNPTSGKFPDFVTITGTNFTGATQVTIGGIPSAKITVVSSTEIKALVRSLAKTGVITVTGPGGTGASSTVFTVTWSANENVSPPTIAYFTPDSGKFPDFITISGTNFTKSATVSIGGVPSAQVLFDSPTQIRALVRSTAYTGPITVTTMGGTATSKTTFTVTKRYD